MENYNKDILTHITNSMDQNPAIQNDLTELGKFTARLENIKKLRDAELTADTPDFEMIKGYSMEIETLEGNIKTLLEEVESFTKEDTNNKNEDTETIEG